MNGNGRSPEPANARLALVSGGDQGPGPGIVRLLATRGLRVISAGRSVRRAQLELDSLGGLADLVAVRELDSTDPVSVARLVSWLAERMGRCDVLVNVVPVRLADDSEAAAPDAVRRAVEADLVGTWMLIRAIVPLMRAHHYGRIVNVLDVYDGWRRPSRPMPAHEVWTTGLAGLTRQLADELGDDGILVNAYWPDVPAPAAVAVGRSGEAALADAVVCLATLPVGGPTGLVHGGRAP